MRSLNAQVAVVTGGAGGLGAAICEGLAAAGCAVVVGYNSSEGPARALAERLPPAALPHADLDGLDDALFDQILATNVRGPFAAVRALKALLGAARADGRTGLVVNISSIAAVTAMGSNVAYCASKAAVDNMTKSLARALAPAIRVLSVSPGLADTDFVKSLDTAWRDEQAGRTPLRRLALPDEVAAAVVAAATHLTFTTGAVLPVDGGRPLA